jgi:hypothetical protein
MENPVKLKKESSIKTMIIVFIIGLAFGFLFSCCINWSHAIEHNQMKTIEDYGTE